MSEEQQERIDVLLQELEAAGASQVDNTETTGVWTCRARIYAAGFRRAVCYNCRSHGLWRTL